MKFHTEFFKSVTKNAITSHPDLRLEKIELKNVQTIGYGTKSFVLSMIEAAIELTNGEVTGTEILEIR